MRQHQFLLRAGQHRRVGDEQRFAGTHRAAGEVHIEPLHPAIEFETHGSDARLVERHLPYTPQLPHDRTALRDRERHAYPRGLRGVEHHRAAHPDWCACAVRVTAGLRRVR